MTVLSNEPFRGDWVDSLTYNYAVKKDRPRQNTLFLIFMGIAGAACVILFAILATVSLNGRSNCQCSVPAACSNGVCIQPTQDQCMTDMNYANCYNTAGQQWQLFAGLAGMGGGLLLLSVLGLRYL